MTDFVYGHPIWLMIYSKIIILFSPKKKIEKREEKRGIKLR
jgi:hypothetical protein